MAKWERDRLEAATATAANERLARKAVPSLCLYARRRHEIM
jgi:predicted type IV restriction endonuclease